MGRLVQPRAAKGSQHWVQEFVRTNSSRLDAAIGLGSLEWLSPTEIDEYAEYRDAAFVERLGVELAQRPLESFWPASGPAWDGLARTSFGTSVLIEAKSHVSEMVSTCEATSDDSREMIRAAFNETKKAFDVDPDIDWFEGHYQYANRLAHAYLLNELNSVPTELVFLYFIGDTEMGGPATREEWRDEVMAVHASLGVIGQLPRYVHDLFVDLSGAEVQVSI